MALPLVSKYVQAVKGHLEGLEFVSVGLCGKCPDCQRDYDMSPHVFYSAVESGEVYDEGHFSWGRCECCGSRLGGNRYAAHGIDQDDNLVHLEVCVDCLQYIANGDEPDTQDNEESAGWPEPPEQKWRS